jgi:hypothetical protein
MAVKNSAPAETWGQKRLMQSHVCSASDRTLAAFRALYAASPKEKYQLQAYKARSNHITARAGLNGERETECGVVLLHLIELPPVASHQNRKCSSAFDALQAISLL